MFYPVEVPGPSPDKKQAAAMVVLSPSQSRRLVAKGAVASPIFQKAYQDGMVIIGRGITNAYVCEELFDISIANKANQTVGLVCDGGTNNARTPPPCTWHVIEKGKVLEDADSNAEVAKFRQGDVVVKGANAIDHTGLTGTYASSLKCGTMGAMWPYVTPRGGEFIVPVSLEKMVPCVMTAAQHSGVYHFDKSTGMPAKIVMLPEAKAITEIEALGILCGVKAYQIGAGGVAGSEGSVHLAIEGDADKVDQAFELCVSLKDEPPVGMPDVYLIDDPAEKDYDARALLEMGGGV
ncbi:MAG: hypothetical protein KQH53_04270 [Desulfarculaceae bacterium]|nr:hypothetical protein [Desulfarculaceae bacterium]